MPFGVLAHIGLGKETTYGTAVAATDYIRFASEGLSEEIEQVVSDNIIGVVDEGTSVEGAHTISGDISFEVYPNNIGHLLRAALGAPVTTSVGTGVYQHVFTPTQSNFSNVCALPPYTFEVNRDLAQAFQYSGGVVDSLTFSFGTDSKIMKASASVIAKALAMITKTTPSFDIADPFLWNQAVITLNGVQNTNLSTLEFGVSNSLEGRATLDGTKVISRVLRNGARTFPIKFSLELQDMAEYNLFKAQNGVPLKIELTGGVISGANNYKITIDVPKFRFNSFPINVDGTGALTVSAEGAGKYDFTSLYGMKVTLVNSKTSY
jgi:hypothetical protein